MRNRRWLACMALVGAAAFTLRGQPPATAPVMSPAAPPATPHFVSIAAFDFAKLLPPPPARDSLVAQAELEVVLQVQAARTPEQIEWAKLVDNDSIFNLAEVFGPWFRRENLPATDAFFKELADDVRAMDRAAKAPFQRARPHMADPAVQPCVRVPTSTSYPSGSAFQACLWSELLADVFPEKRTELMARARRAAWGRVLGGVHFPSDLAAGEALVPSFLAECRKNPAFRKELDDVRGELIAAKPSP